MRVRPVTATRGLRSPYDRAPVTLIADRSAVIGRLQRVERVRTAAVRCPLHGTTAEPAASIRFATSRVTATSGESDPKTAAD